MRRFVVVLLLAYMWSPSAHATTFAYSIDEGAWQADSSIFACSLTHTVPFYGEAVFRTRAGERSKFFLAPITDRLKTGKASLRVSAPVWRHNSAATDLAYVPVEQGEMPIKMGNKGAERLLSELLNGMELTFTRAPWYGAKESSKVKVAPIGFRASYQQYLSCLDSLLPVNFEQIEKTAVYFGSNKHEDITQGDRKRLDHIVLYAKADPSVKEFYIDGHTDKVGMRKDNLALAERRAMTVSNYLVAKGLEKEKIKVRWHGERYPVTKNTTVAGRAKNRRVTIRLDRVELEE